MLAMLLAAAAPAPSACAPSCYDSYSAGDRSLLFAYPVPGASLHETLAWIHAPPAGDWNVLVSRLDVVRLTESGPVKLDRQEVQQALTATSTETYAVVATVRCRPLVDLVVYAGEKTAWMLLPEGGLAGAEEDVLPRRDGHSPKSMVDVGELYAKGLAYLQIGRVSNARAMLEAGDAGVDVRSRGDRGERWLPGRERDTLNASQIARLRDQLVAGLSRAQEPR